MARAELTAPAPRAIDDGIRRLLADATAVARRAAALHATVLDACADIAATLAPPGRTAPRMEARTLTTAERTGACDLAASLTLDALASAERADAPVALVTVRGTCGSDAIDSCDSSRVLVYADTRATPEMPALVDALVRGLPPLVDASGERGLVAMRDARTVVARVDALEHETESLDPTSRSAFAHARDLARAALRLTGDSVKASAALTVRTVGVSG